jgi:hypothetical protein
MQLWVFKQAHHFLQESRVAYSIQNAMVAGEAQEKYRFKHYLAVFAYRSLLDPANRQDHALRWVVNGLKQIDPIHPQVGQPKTAAAHLIGLQYPLLSFAGKP